MTRISEAKAFPALVVPDGESPAFRRVQDLAAEVAGLARRILGSKVEVIWFGSWPKGRAHERSDVDLAIRSSTKLSAEDLHRLRAEVDDLPTLYSIDVVDFAEADTHLREEIERYGKRL